MIVADTSALAAVIFGEEDAERFLTTLHSDAVLMSAVTLVEAGIVVEARHGPDGVRDLDLLVAGTVSRIVPVDEDHARAAVAAWRRFGKGRHRAGLNLGDCFTYATAKLAGAALLFKGDDFAQTDVPSAG